MIHKSANIFQMAQTVSFYRLTWNAYSTAQKKKADSFLSTQIQVHGTKLRAFTEHKRNCDGLTILDQDISEIDLAVILDHSLKFREDIISRVSQASRMMHIIRRSFCHLNANMFKLLYKSLIRPHIKYAAAIWSPRYISDIKIIETIQRKDTAHLTEMKSLRYQEQF